MLNHLLHGSSKLATKQIATASLLMAFSTTLLAEGSAQLGLNQRIVDHDEAIVQGWGGTLSDTRAASWFVDIQSAGEVINVSLCGRNNTDDITVEFYAPSDDVTPIATQNLTDGNIDCADPMDTPFTNPIRYTTLEAGTYRLVLQNTTGTNSLFDSVFYRYDITVTPDVTTDPDPTANGGRVWLYSLNQYQFGYGAADLNSADLYVKADGGRPNTEYVWQVDLNNVGGRAFSAKSNAIGVEAPYSGYSAATAPDNVQYEHQMYLSYPATTNPRPTIAPTLSGVRFVDSDGQDYGISPSTTNGVQDTGTFEFTTDVTGTYAIFIDINQDGIYGNTGDRHLSGRTVVGLNQVTWDGTDDAGVPLAAGVYHSKVQVRLGEVHFLTEDSETSGGGVNDGLTIHLANPDNTTTPTTVFWDDSFIFTSGTANNLPDGALSSTPEGHHTWGSFIESDTTDVTGAAAISGPIADTGDATFDTYAHGLSTIWIAPTAITDTDDLLVNFDGPVTADSSIVAGAAVNVSVSDNDLNADTGLVETIDVEVVNDTTGEVETVTLTETGANTGVFTAALPTTETGAAGTDNDGSMNVQPNNIITVTYNDLITASFTGEIRSVSTSVQGPYISTGLNGGCSISATSSRDPLLPLLALASIMFLIRRRSNVPAVVAAALIGSVAIDAPSNIASAQNYEKDIRTGVITGDDNQLKKHIYIGIGGGASLLSPDTSQAPAFDAIEEAKPGAQITLGMDINKWFSLELHATELSDADLTPAGSINYKTAGGSALFYLGKNRHNKKRSGLTAYGRLGAGVLANEPSDATIPFQQSNANHFLVGGGLEYTLNGGLGFRAEFIHFDADAQYAQLGLLYRFDKRSKTKKVKKPKPAKASKNNDIDGDGVANSADECPNTSIGSNVDSNGCASFNGVLDGVNFLSGSSALTAEAKVKLLEVVSTLKAYPRVKFTLSAHTDNQPFSKGNLTLSKARVLAVGRFLRNEGIDKSRFTLRAFGDKKPIASNFTAAGRALNRRVELQVNN